MSSKIDTALSFIGKGVNQDIQSEWVLNLHLCFQVIYH